MGVKKKGKSRIVALFFNQNLKGISEKTSRTSVPLDLGDEVKLPFLNKNTIFCAKQSCVIKKLIVDKKMHM